jgi:hypothetical protein
MTLEGGVERKREEKEQQEEEEWWLFQYCRMRRLEGRTDEQGVRGGKAAAGGDDGNSGAHRTSRTRGEECGRSPMLQLCSSYTLYGGCGWWDGWMA